MKYRTKKVLLLSFFFSSLCAQEPWFTGPLIAPVGEVIPFEHFEIDSYVYCNIYTGSYDKDWHSQSTAHFYETNPQFLCYFGLTPWMDLQITPQFFYNATEGQQDCGFGDFNAGVDFQLYPSDKSGWFPGVKLSIQETFPTGKFDHFNPKKLQTDFFGYGTFASSLSLVFYKVYQPFPDHFLSLTISSQYTASTAVNVSGFNAYGGGYETKGKVHPGHRFQQIVSFEFSLSQNWNLALDNIWTHTDTTHFEGTSGVNLLGEPAVTGLPSSDQLSFAPAIEYSFSETLGIIGGCWFTALGRNGFEVRSGAVNLYYYY